MDETTKLIAAAATGAVAAIFVRVGIRFVQFVWLRKIVRWKDYDCSLDLKIEGGIFHRKGERVPDRRASNGWAWKYASDQGKEATPIYGPYTNDFSKPGSYKIRFEVRTEGLDKTSDASPALKLEVVGSSPDFKGGQWVMGSTEFGQLFLTQAQLSQSKKYRKYDIKFWTDGSGRYEYRAGVLEKSWPADKKIFFDRIRIRPWMFFREIFV